MTVTNWFEVFVTGCNFKSKNVEIAQLSREERGCFHGSPHLPFPCQLVNPKNSFADQRENKNKWKTYFLHASQEEVTQEEVHMFRG